MKNHDQALRHLRKSDPILAALMKRAGPYELKVERRRSPYEALVKSVVYQQLAGNAARAIYGRVLALFPEEKLPHPAVILETADEKLRSAGLSRSKLLSIKDVALKTVEGVVPDRKTISRLSDDDIIERLTRIRGVGPWTVQMLLMFTLGRPDVLPASDYGVRVGFKLAYRKRELPPPAKILLHGECWRPYRSVAAWYLWRAVDLHRQKA